METYYDEYECFASERETPAQKRERQKKEYREYLSRINKQRGKNSKQRF